MTSVNQLYFYEKIRFAPCVCCLFFLLFDLVLQDLTSFKI
jgi:hypothetical protein